VREQQRPVIAPVCSRFRRALCASRYETRRLVAWCVISNAPPSHFFATSRYPQVLLWRSTSRRSYGAPVPNAQDAANAMNAMPAMPLMTDEPHVRDRALDLAAADIDRARRMLDGSGAAAIPAARRHLEAATARLGPVAADDHVDADVRRAAERCRATLSSHLLAADNLEVVGFEPDAVLTMLARGATAGLHEAAAAASPAAR
jgi:hypothetical protein